MQCHAHLAMTFGSIFPCRGLLFVLDGFALVSAVRDEDGLVCVRTGGR